MTFFICNVLNVTPLKSVLIDNQERKIRPVIMYINSDEPSFYPFSVQKNKCSGSCNNINDSYANFCVLDVVRNINVKVFNLMSRTNETRHIKWHKTYTCKCRPDASVCNDQKR